MVAKINRKNAFSKRRPYTQARKQKQCEYLERARLARASKPKNTIKCLTNREISNKLQELHNGPNNSDDPIVMDTIDILNLDIQDLKSHLDESTHGEEISILNDDINDLKLEIANLVKTTRGLVNQISNIEAELEASDDRLNELIDLTL